MTETTGPHWGARFTNPPVPGVDLTESDVDTDVRFKEQVARLLVEQPWNRYPERLPVRASARLGKVLGVAPGRFALTSGCTEALRCAFLHAHHRGMELHVPVPSYPGYARVQRAFGAEHHTYTYDARTPPAEVVRYVRALDDRGSRAVVVGSPGNPVGPSWRASELDRLSGTGVGLVILDLTYAFFDPDAVELLRFERPNVVQCLSLSKSHSLAGARIGAMAADPDLLGPLQELQPDFPLDLFQLSVGHALCETSFLAKNWHRAQRVRDISGTISRMVEETDGLSVVSGVTANFVTVSADDEWWNVLVGSVRTGKLRAKVFEEHRLIRVTATSDNARVFPALLKGGSA